MQFLIFFLFGWALLFFHSCMPGGDQRTVLSLSRAEDDVLRDYTESFYVQPLFQTATKRCPHCNKLVESEISVGECMFRELTNLPENSPRTAELFTKTRRQLRGEAADGYGPANYLLGFIAENGLFGTRQDVISAARHYRLFADTGTPRGRAVLASFWIRLGENLPSAIDLLKKALEEEPRDTECYLNLAQAYTLQGKVRDAFESVKKAYYYSPVNSRERAMIEAEFIRRLMAAAPEIGFDDALAQINDLIYLSPKNPELPLLRGDIYAVFGRFAEAEKEYSAQEGKAPELPFRFGRARVRAAAKNFQGAHEDIEKLLKEYPEDFTVRSAKLGLLLTEGRTKDAFSTVEEYIASDKDKIPAYLLRANLHINVRDYPAAIADLEAAKKEGADAGEIDERIRNLRASMEQEKAQEKIQPGT